MIVPPRGGRSNTISLDRRLTRNFVNLRKLILSARVQRYLYSHIPAHRNAKSIVSFCIVDCLRILSSTIKELEHLDRAERTVLEQHLCPRIDAILDNSGCHEISSRVLIDRFKHGPLLNAACVDLFSLATRLICFSRLHDILVEHILYADITRPDKYLILLFDTNTRSFYRQVNHLLECNRALEEDPSGVYVRSCPQTQLEYARAAEQCAKEFDIESTHVVDLCNWLSRSTDSNGSVTSGHFLLGGGLQVLRSFGNMNTGTCSESFLSKRKKDFSKITLIQCAMTILSVVVITIALAIAPSSGLGLLYIFATIVLLERCVMADRILRPSRKQRVLPKYNDEESIDAYKVAILVPVLLSTKEQTLMLLHLLSDNIKSCHDVNCVFAISTDFQDRANAEPTYYELELLQHLKEGVCRVAKKHSADVLILHRDRTLSPGSNLYGGWERKRGKIVQFNEFIACGKSCYREVYGDVSALNSVDYAMVIDEDSRLHESCVRNLLLSALHPLNYRPGTASRPDSVGYGVFVPASGVSAADWKAWRIGSLVAGPIDPPRRSVDFERYSESAYCGKGLYQIKNYMQIMKDVLPESCILSHDTLEGAYLRAAFVQSARITEGFPRKYNSLNQRQHRWFRGDVQNIAIAIKRRLIPYRLRPFTRNQLFLHIITKFGIIAYPVFLLALCIEFSQLSKVLTLIFIACILPFLFVESAFRITINTRIADFSYYILSTLISYIIAEVVRIIIALNKALLLLDASFLSLFRLFTKKNLLEWKTGGAATNSFLSRSQCVEYTSSLLSFVVLTYTRPTSVPLLALLIAWAGSPIIVRICFQRAVDE